MIPLTAKQLRLLVENKIILESELDCDYQAEPIIGFFFEILKGQLAITEKDPENYKWHSFWLIIRKSDRVVIGSADFKDIPNDKHEVEIGYGLGKAFEHNGYMTEVVHAMCVWAMQQKSVLHVIAETDIDGLKSQGVLQRCGFKEYSRGKTIWWRL